MAGSVGRFRADLERAEKSTSGLVPAAAPISTRSCAAPVSYGSARSHTSDRVDRAGDHPAVRGDRPGAQERPRQRAIVGLLRVALDRAAAVAGDLVQRPAERGVGDAAAAQALAGEEAGNAPVREGGEAVVVAAPALDLRQLAGRSELAPAQALVAVEDERGVGAALVYALLLLGSVLRRGAPLAQLDVEAHAPAASPHAVVRLDQPGKRGPRVHVQRPDGEATGHLACRSRAVQGHVVSMPAGR